MDERPRRSLLTRIWYRHWRRLWPEIGLYDSQEEGFRACQQAMSQYGWLVILAMPCYLALLISLDKAGWLTMPFAPRISNLVILAFLIISACLAIPLCYKRGVTRRLRRDLCQRGIPVCFECGYDLRGTESDVCPECGSNVSVAVKQAIEALMTPAEGEG